MASKNLYQAAASEEGSELPAAPTTTGDFGAVQERETQNVTWGPRTGILGLGSLPFDYAAAVSDREVRFRVTTNRVMPLDEASTRLAGLMQVCGVAAQADNVQLAFLRAILLAHAKNSASVIQPSRAMIYINGGRPINFFTDVVHFLGDDTRRFFRAYADITRTVVRSYYDRYNRGDLSVAEDVRDLDWVADDRGLSRFKDLVADGSDACSNLTRSERQALGMAKQSIFASGGNAVDVVQTYRQQTERPSITQHSATDRRSAPAPQAGVPDY